MTTASELRSRGFERHVGPLPAPRLQLVWERTGEHRSVCWYEIVIPATINGTRDIRATDYPKRRRLRYGYTDGHNHIHVIGRTERGGRVGEMPDTPFRDGAHALWDSESLGIPAFVVDGDNVFQLILRTRVTPPG